MTLICISLASRCRSFEITCSKGGLQSQLSFLSERTNECFPPSLSRLHMSSTPTGRQPCPSLTVIIPAFNEVLRIGETLQAYSTILASSDLWNDVTHLLVVDDGSTDGTADFVREFPPCQLPLTCVSLNENRGKGAALSFGIRQVLESSPPPGLILIVDADGSGDMKCLDAAYDRLRDLIEDDWTAPAIVVGNRGYQGTSLVRSILRWGFRICVRVVCGDMHVQDTQCGFKLMTTSGGKLLYTGLHLQGWSHDVEVLYRAKEMGIFVGEVVVDWQDKDGSKLIESPGGTLGVSLTMLLEIVMMRVQYAIGSWKIPV